MLKMAVKRYFVSDITPPHATLVDVLNVRERNSFIILYRSFLCNIYRWYDKETRKATRLPDDIISIFQGTCPLIVLPNEGALNEEALDKETKDMYPWIGLSLIVSRHCGNASSNVMTVKRVKLGATTAIEQWSSVFTIHPSSDPSQAVDILNDNQILVEDYDNGTTYFYVVNVSDGTIDKILYTFVSDDYEVQRHIYKGSLWDSFHLFQMLSVYDDIHSVWIDNDGMEVGADVVGYEPPTDFIIGNIHSQDGFYFCEGESLLLKNLDSSTVKELPDFRIHGGAKMGPACRNWTDIYGWYAQGLLVIEECDVSSYMEVHDTKPACHSKSGD